MTKDIQKIKIAMAGDVMLGRLVDQLQPIHCQGDSEETSSANHIKKLYPSARSVEVQNPFGNTISLFLDSDLRIINLETCITKSTSKWPNKTFHFRMHPMNISILKNAKIDYCSLANNHVLDYGASGLNDTMSALNLSDILYAGVGKNQTDATEAKYLQIQDDIVISFLSASDHPSNWSHISNFHFVDTDNPPMEKLRDLVQKASRNSDFVIFSLHWGPNYQWYPELQIRKLAHALIDFGVDLIHGHSSHHPQGIEIYHGKAIFYGCGDFIDDYMVDCIFRNDLGFLYKLEYEVSEILPLDDNLSSPVSEEMDWEYPTITSFLGKKKKKDLVRYKRKKLCISKIELVPVKIELMKVNRATNRDDVDWLYNSMSRLCHDMGTTIKKTTDKDGKSIFKVECL